MESKKDTTKNTTKLCVTRQELPQLLGCGLYTADKIAKDSGARFRVGKRVLIYLPKVEAYLADKTE